MATAHPAGVVLCVASDASLDPDADGASDSAYSALCARDHDTCMPATSNESASGMGKILTTRVSIDVFAIGTEHVFTSRARANR